MSIIQRFLNLRNFTETVCKPLQIEDYVVQPAEFVSPPKWHLGHTTWFWEEFVLSIYAPNYERFNQDFAFHFNSYYNNIGKRVKRALRGMNSRPTLKEVYAYRTYVTDKMLDLLNTHIDEELKSIVEIGLNHEEQHQELLVYDIKYILGNQPFFPAYGNGFEIKNIESKTEWIAIKEGIYEIGHGATNSFCFDNELGQHKQYLNAFEISSNVVTNAEFLAFVEDQGYRNFNFWHDEGWAWIVENDIEAPLYWHHINGVWYEYELNGLRPLELNSPVKHVSFYESSAFAQWKGTRLPTEYEWEIAASRLNKGDVWEWTNSAYLPYPNFKKASGALGEYNGKFMINQMVLRASSVATPPNHSRITYRNFFHPNMRWQYAGFRLIKPQ